MGRLSLYVVACFAVASTANADTVLLANGNRIENVVAKSEGGGVTIRYSYGEMSLPAAMVAGVEKAESTLERYLAAAEALASDRDATAAAWLELAFTARADGLDDGYRRALLRAAALDPDWPPLAAPLRGLDYVLDPTRGYWLPYEQSAAAIAQVAEREAERRTVAGEEARLARAARRERLVETLELALLAQVVDDLTEREPEPAPQTGIALWGPYVTSPVVLSGPAFGPVRGWHDTAANRATLRALTRRQPGSLLPVRPLVRHVPRTVRSSAKRSGGS